MPGHPGYPGAGPCALHVLVALDVTDYQQSNLQPYLERVLRDLAALDHLTCSPLNLSISLQSARRDGDALFQDRLREPWVDVLQRLVRAHAFQRSYLNQPALQSFLGTLAQQAADAKVLLVFTDGLDDDAGKMKEAAMSAWLQDQADLLVMVAVNNVTGLGDLQQMEFGRWLGSGQQLAVDMPEAGGHVAQELGPPGEAGSDGVDGEQGKKGNRGSPGPGGQKGYGGAQPCELKAFIRQNCVTTSPSCPLFPTELVLVLETSSTVPPALFSRMKELLALLLRDLQVSPLGCPAGARVAMLAYAATPTYLLRAGEAGSGAALLGRLRRLSPTRSSRRGRLAAAMRFVGHHTLKRVRPAALGRKVVLFITSGRSQNLEGIGEAALQYEALGIVPAVLTFSPLPEVVRAFQVNSLFQVVQLSAAEPARNAAVLRDVVLPCVLCFGRQPRGGTGDGCPPALGLSLNHSPCPDLCHPEGCAAAVPSPGPLDVDLALVVDNAAPGMLAERLEAIGDLFHRLLGHLQLAGTDPAEHGARIALVLTGPSAPGQGLAEVPFGLPGSREQLWNRIRLALVPRVAVASAGSTVAWTLRHTFPQSSGSRLRVLFVVWTGATVLWDGEAQQALAPFARCEDFGVLVLSLGRAGTERPEAAVPEVLPEWRCHSLRLGSVHPPEMGYAERTALGFLRRLRGE
ncbi:collagen alpha-3(VI) chain-like [Grus japonensis]|uniref:Collagen alpha-3(VI) chain-like n=1 Tax=Grus japonensis TaxID=30415 RepID=A0ABC9XR77_GRUJA